MFLSVNGPANAVPIWRTTRGPTETEASSFYFNVTEGQGPGSFFANILFGTYNTFYSEQSIKKCPKITTDIDNQAHVILNVF